MDVHVCFAGNGFDVEVLHDYEDVVSFARCGSVDNPKHDFAACNSGASCLDVMEENADDDAHSFGSCEQEEDEEDIMVKNKGYLRVAATCIDAALQNDLDTEPAQAEEEEEEEKAGGEEEETEDELFELDKLALDAAASKHFVDMGLAWPGVDGQDSDVSTQLPEDAAVASMTQKSASSAAMAESVVEPALLLQQNDEEKASPETSASNLKVDTMDKEAFARTPADTLATIAAASFEEVASSGLTQSPSEKQHDSKKVAPPSPEMQFTAQVLSTTHEKVMPFPPSWVLTAKPLVPLGPLPPGSPPAGNLRNQFRSFRIHSKPTCEPLELNRTCSSVGNTNEAVGETEFHRIADASQGSRAAFAGKHPAAFVRVPEPSMSDFAMDLGKDAIEMLSSNAGSRSLSARSIRLSSTVGPLAPIRPPSMGRAKLQQPWLPTDPAVSVPLSKPPMSTDEVCDEPTIHQRGVSGELCSGVPAVSSRQIQSWVATTCIASLTRPEMVPAVFPWQIQPWVATACVASLTRLEIRMLPGWMLLAVLSRINLRAISKIC